MAASEMRITRTEGRLNTRKIHTPWGNFTARHVAPGDEAARLGHRHLIKTVAKICDSEGECFYLRGNAEGVAWPVTGSPFQRQQPRVNVVYFGRNLVPHLINEDVAERFDALTNRIRDIVDENAVEGSDGEETSDEAEGTTGELHVKSFARKPDYLEYYLKVSDWHARNGRPFPRDDSGRVELTAQLVAYAARPTIGEGPRIPSAVLTTTPRKLRCLLRDSAAREWFAQHSVRPSRVVERL